MQHQLKSNFSAVKTPRQTTCTAQSQPRNASDWRKKPHAAKKKESKDLASKNFALSLHPQLSPNEAKVARLAYSSIG